MRAEVAAHRVAGDLADLAGELDARRAAADDEEGEPGAPSLGVVVGLGGLERREDAAADLDRVLEASSGPGASGSHSSWPK